VTYTLIEKIVFLTGWRCGSNGRMHLLSKHKALNSNPITSKKSLSRACYLHRTQYEEWGHRETTDTNKYRYFQKLPCYKKTDSFGNKVISLA
jgi:hypothetical protein